MATGLVARFARRLREVRERSGMGQGELARAIRVSERTMNDYERGRKFPRPQRIEQIARLLGVDPGDLFIEHQPHPHGTELLRRLQDQRPNLAVTIVTLIRSLLSD